MWGSLHQSATTSRAGGIPSFASAFEVVVQLMKKFLPFFDTFNQHIKFWRG